MVLNVASATRPYPGEKSCGDACGHWNLPTQQVFVVVDGLGHGRQAAHAAHAAMLCISKHLGESCEELFARCDKALRHTRGAAMAIAILEPDNNLLTLATVGNIRAMLIRSQKNLRFDGSRGIVGAGYALLHPETITLIPDDILALFTDGFAEFPPLRDFLQHNRLPLTHTLEQIIQQFARPDDDAGILMYRHKPQQGCSYD